MNTNVITNARQIKTNKSVLLFSGGMDSVCFDYLLNPDILLYIPSGSSYENIETQKIKNLANKGIIDNKKLVILDDVLNLSMFERDDAIVPNRNAYLIMLASHFGETIYLGSIQGDRSFDKDKTFYELIQNLLNHIWQDQHWTEERKFIIKSPYKHTTKTELVKEYIKKGGNPQNILDSYSCYTGEEPTCGICKPCVRKWISLVNNNIEIPKGYYKHDPRSAEWIPKVMDQIKVGKYRGKEDFDFLKALGIENA